MEDFSCIARPIGKWIGVSERRKYGRKNNSIRFIIKKSKLDKFADSFWRMFCYASLWLYGITTLWHKDYFWDTTLFWIGYPKIPLENDIWLYYMLEATFYWSLMFSQFFDAQIQRKDFVMNFIHHFATLVLIWLSWADNFCRIGAIVMVIHDLVDPFMELGKMGRYCGRPDVCNAFGAVFFVLWFITRCGIYPYKILYSSLIEAPALIAWYPIYYVFNFFLLVLQVLHLLWSYMIIQIIIKAATTDGEFDDNRSEADSNDEEEEDEVDAHTFPQQQQKKSSSNLHHNSSDSNFSASANGVSKKMQ